MSVRVLVDPATATTFNLSGSLPSLFMTQCKVRHEGA